MYPMGIPNIGTETNNMTPQAVRARVFVGNLNTMKCTRLDLDNLFRPFGRVVAISVHKGYAFVQYSLEYNARTAVESLNGRLFFNQKLDLNIACEPKPGQKRPAPSGSSQQQPQPLFPDSQLGGMKRPRQELLPPPDGDIGDILICGNCKEQYTDLQLFLEHRNAPCRMKFSCKCVALQTHAVGEPATLVCSTCGGRFTNAWDLITHAQSTHNIQIFEHLGDPMQNSSQGNGNMKEDYLDQGGFSS